jgi:hypothetical protein
VVDVMVAVVFEVVADQCLPVMMVMILRGGGRNRGLAESKQPENDSHSCEKTLYTIHGHG